MFGLSIEERAAKKGTYWRIVHDATGDVLEGEELLRLAEECAERDFRDAPFNMLYHNPRYTAYFILSYTHSHVVSDMPVMPKEAVVGWAEQETGRNLG